MYTINRRGHGAVVGAADDGLADGAPATSSTATVLNTVPTAPGVSVRQHRSTAAASAGRWQDIPNWTPYTPIRPALRPIGRKKRGSRKRIGAAGGLSHADSPHLPTLDSIDLLGDTLPTQTAYRNCFCMGTVIRGEPVVGWIFSVMKTPTAASQHGEPAIGIFQPPGGSA